MHSYLGACYLYVISNIISCAGPNVVHADFLFLIASAASIASKSSLFDKVPV